MASSAPNMLDLPGGKLAMVRVSNRPYLVTGQSEEELREEMRKLDPNPMPFLGEWIFAWSSESHRWLEVVPAGQAPKLMFSPEVINEGIRR